MRTLIVSNRLDPFNGNLGDFASDPSLYFPWLRDARHVQLDRIGAKIIPIPRLGHTNVIVGGGGLFETTLPAFKWGMARVLRNVDPFHAVVWGAGVNAHGFVTSSTPSCVEDFKLVGLRDAGLGYRWVPCASVMLPELRVKHQTRRDVVVYDNWQFPWSEGQGYMPRMNNNRRFRSAQAKRQAVNEVVAFLGSAEYVLTSSYHGVLWATLLGKKVIVTNPFSSKFNYFRHPPAVLEKDEDWESAADRAMAYPNALQECREVTCNFSNEVRALFGL